MENHQNQSLTMLEKKCYQIKKGKQKETLVYDLQILTF